MKKLLAKDKKNRKFIRQLELKQFILKQISTNSNFIKTIRWNALHELNNNKKGSKTILSNRCIKTINKKTFNKFSKFSRVILIKLIRTGQINSVRKASW